MKIIKVFILFIFSIYHTILLSNSLIQINNYCDSDSTQVYYFTRDFTDLVLGNVYILDTATILASYYDKLDNPYNLYQSLSNSGLAIKDINNIYINNCGFNSQITAFSSYLHNVNNIKYPLILQPITEISYISANQKEQYLDVFFSREFLPRFYLTINYDVDFSPGVYKRSRTQNSFFNTNFRYNTKNNRYGINACYFLDKIDVQENGGVVSDSVFIKNLETDKSIIDVNLIGASNLIKSSGFAINQYYNILSPNFIDSNDSINLKNNVNLGRINYHFSYNRQSYIYEDTKPTSPFYQNFDPVINTSKTFDSISFYNIKNSIYWNTLGYRRYDNDVPFYLTLGLEHNFTYHAGYVDILTQERFNNINYSNIRANTGIILNILKSTKITANSQIIISGYQAGDFYIDAQWKQYLGTTKKNVGALVFDFNLNRQSADWFEEYYYSNNFRCNNDFNKETYLMLKGSYQLPFLEIGLKQTNISNYIYFGTNAKPQQYTGNVSISSLYSTFNFKLNKFEMIGYVSLQTTNNDDIIHLPDFQGKIKLAYNIDLVKNISMMQPSIVINYFTAYYADAYMPALRTFYLQENVKVGNFPYIDFCVTFKIKNANVFVLYTNIYSLTGDNRYFTTPHYPMRDSRLCLGVKWRLYK